MTVFHPFSVNAKFLGETRQSGFPEHMLCNCVGRPFLAKGRLANRRQVELHVVVYDNESC